MSTQKTESHLALIEEAKELKIKGAHLFTNEANLAMKIAKTKGEIPNVVKSLIPAAALAGEKKSPERQKYEMAVKMILQTAHNLRTGLGQKNRRYLEYVMCYKDVIPDEYKQVAHIIQEELLP